MPKFISSKSASRRGGLKTKEVRKKVAENFNKKKAKANKKLPWWVPK